MLGMFAPMMAFSIPLLDTSLAIARRFLRKESIFGADRGHIHHRLLDRGLSPRKVAFLLYGICAIAALFSLVMVNDHYEVLIIAIFCTGTWYGVQRLGYIEFDMAGRMLLQGSFRRLLNAHISIHNFESALTLASTPDDCWSVLEKAYKDFGFCQIEMQLAGHSYVDDGATPDAFRAWRLQIPLSGGDYVRLTREFGPNPQHNVVASFADVLRKTLESKLLGFAPATSPEPLAVEANSQQWHYASAGNSCSDR
jgi:UDP-GlcNAc:undecaprenyl-phosphate GlcNAc-1-phosphate transferase